MPQSIYRIASYTSMSEQGRNETKLCGEKYKKMRTMQTIHISANVAKKWTTSLNITPSLGHIFA